MEERAVALKPDEVADLEAKCRWVRDHYDESARGAYLSVDGKLQLLDTILPSNWITAAETLKLQCLGVTFGDALAQQSGLIWVAVDDQRGRDPTLTLEGSTLRIFPLTSISKRVDRGEDVDVYALFDDACATIEQLRGEGV